MRMMMGTLAVCLVALAAPAWSADIYRWRDDAGRLHFSNVPADAREWVPASVPIEEAQPEAAQPAAIPAVADASAPADGEAASPAPKSDEELAAYSASTSLRRNALERDLRATEKRIQEIDGRLEALAAARTRNARGSEATGGVGTSAFDLRSEEEKALAAEREQLGQHGADVRNDAAKLKGEVATQLGGTPVWWTDPR